MSTLHEYLQVIIQEELDKSQEDFKKAYDASRNPKLNLKDKQLKEATPPAIPPVQPPMVDPNLPPPATDPTTGQPSADPSMGGIPTDPTLSGGATDPSLGGGGALDMGGGSSSMGGFGGGLSGEDPEGGEDASGSESSDETGNPSDLEGNEGDPIESLVSDATELLNQTQDPNLIFKDMKQKIQSNFDQPENALGLVKALYDTHQPVLQSVAEKLYLFLKTKPPIQLQPSLGLTT